MLCRMASVSFASFIEALKEGLQQTQSVNSRTKARIAFECISNELIDVSELKNQDRRDHRRWAIWSFRRKSTG